MSIRLQTRRAKVRKLAKGRWRVFYRGGLGESFVYFGARTDWDSHAEAMSHADAWTHGRTVQI